MPTETIELKKVDDIKPLYISKHGIEVYTEDDYNRIHNYQSEKNEILKHRGQKEEKITNTAFVDENLILNNYYRKNEDGTFDVCFDPVAISVRNGSGSITKPVTVHKVNEHGKLLNTLSVSWNCFLTEFYGVFNKKEALLIYAQIHDLTLPV